MHDHLPPEFVDAAGKAAQLLGPSVIGATIAVATKGRTLTWSDRLMQILIGTAISYYMRLVAIGVWDLGDVSGQAVGFTAGLLACDALPKLRERTVARLVELPDMLFDWIARHKSDGK